MRSNYTIHWSERRYILKMNRNLFNTYKKLKDDNPLISIILPVYNADKYLKRCLNSIRSQDYPNIEVLIIDNGSTDHSNEICQDYLSCDPRFHLFFQEERGVSNARNLGLDKAAGVYLLFIDSDDYIERNYVTKLWETISMTDKTMAVCDYRQECALTTEKDMAHYTALPGCYSRKAFINQVSKCPGAHYFGVLWNKIYETDLIRRKGIKFDKNLSLGEDFSFNMEYLSLVNRVKVISDKLYIYSWQNPESLTFCKKNIKKQMEERLMLYQAYKSLFRREKLGQSWDYKLHYYMLKAYFEETKTLGEESSKYQDQFYQSYIKNTGIGDTEFKIVCLLKKIKHLVKI